MRKTWVFAILFVTLIFSGCASVTNRPQLNADPKYIIQTAVTRAQDEWLCGGVNGAIKEVRKPPERKNWYDPDLPTEYAVAVEGCGKSSVYTIVCPLDAARCYAVVPGEQAPVYIQEIVPGSGITPVK